MEYGPAPSTIISFHIHRPFISDDQRIANAGSWVTDAQIHNTFVELDEQQLCLWNFKDKNTVNSIADSLILHVQI
jgi:hypothetical protein